MIKIQKQLPFNDLQDPRALNLQYISPIPLHLTYPVDSVTTLWFFQNFRIDAAPGSLCLLLPLPGMLFSQLVSKTPISPPSQ